MKIFFGLLVIGLTLSLVGTPSTHKGLVTFMADYDTNWMTSDTGFVLYSSTNLVEPLVNWSVITNVDNSLCITNGTNIILTIPLGIGTRFFYLTASNYFGESDPSNVTNTIVPGRGNNFRISGTQ